jgi:hypothetical protein
MQKTFKDDETERTGQDAPYDPYKTFGDYEQQKKTECFIFKVHA